MIKFRFENVDSNEGRYTKVYCNDAFVGCLLTIYNIKNALFWDPSSIINLRFQYRNQSTFKMVVNGLKKYATNNGFEYLLISNIENENNLLSALGYERIYDVGFKKHKVNDFMYI